MDEDQMAVAAYINANIPPKAVFVHKDVHITPSGCLAGRPTLISYNGKGALSMDGAGWW